jgi:predicted  nucleic acid-binding Zn-ribbon protein
MDKRKCLECNSMQMDKLQQMIDEAEAERKQLQQKIDELPDGDPRAATWEERLTQKEKSLAALRASLAAQLEKEVLIIKQQQQQEASRWASAAVADVSNH